MITSGQLTASNTPTQIDGTSNNSFRLIIHNMDATENIYIGNETVSVSQGFALPSGGIIQFDMNPLEKIYVVSPQNNHEISWLKQV
jgi:hypothetical protein